MEIAKTMSVSLAALVLFMLFFNPTNSEAFSREITRNEIGHLNKKQKLSHLHFYFHDTVSGHNPTAVQIAGYQISQSSPTKFGYLAILDDPLTIGPDPRSKIVGRAQGMYASADMNQLGLMMTMNFFFTEGKFNGSTLSVLGRNAVFSAVREMPILGGAGVFRFARGYAEARTHEVNWSTGDAVVEYNVYVFHY